MRVESAEHKRCPKQCSKKLKERDKNEHFFFNQEKENIGYRSWYENKSSPKEKNKNTEKKYNEVTGYRSSLIWTRPKWINKIIVHIDSETIRKKRKYTRFKNKLWKYILSYKDLIKFTKSILLLTERMLFWFNKNSFLKF